MFEAYGVAAVMPIGSSSAEDAMSIASIERVEGDSLVLMDGRTFQLRDGVWESDDGQTYVVPASKHHLQVVHRRTRSR